MKKGKVILSAAAFLLSAGSTFAFKVANKFGGATVYVPTIGSTSSGDHCQTCQVLATNSSGNVKSCVTIDNGKLQGRNLNGNRATFFKSRGTGSNKTCLNPVTKVAVNS